MGARCRKPELNMKKQISTGVNRVVNRFKIFCSLYLLLFTIPCFAQLPTNYFTPSAAAVMATTNGVLTAPTSFFTANAAAIAAVAGAGSQSPLIANVNGAGKSITNLGTLNVTNLNATNISGSISSAVSVTGPFYGGDALGTQAGGLILSNTAAARTHIGLDAFGQQATNTLQAGSGPLSNLVATAVTPLGAVPLAAIYGASDLADYAANLQIAVWSNSTVFSETWANLSAWGAAGLSVSNGAVYSTFANPSGANHSFNLTTNDEARIIGSFTVPSTGTSSSSVFMGVNYDAVGATPTTSLGNLFAAGLSGSGGNNTITWTGATPSNVGGVNGFVTNGTRVNYSLYLDTNNFSWVIRWGSPAITNEFRAIYPRSSWAHPINNIEIWNGDSRGYAGIGWNQIGARKAAPTVAPRNSVEGQSDFVIWTSDGAAISPQQIRVWQPAAYDSVTNIGNVILHFHGHGGDAHSTFDANGDLVVRAYYAALVASNYTIIASDLGGGDGVWGSPLSVEAAENALKWYRARYSYSNLYVMADSAGGASALNFIASHKEKVAGVVLHYPVCAVSNMYVHGWTTQIDAAYGGSSSNEFAGYDPVYENPRVFYGVPFRIYASSGDTIVTKAQNADLFVTKLGGTVNANVTAAAFSPEVDEVATSGDHGDDSNFDSASDVAFFKRCLAYSLNNQGVSIHTSLLSGTVGLSNLPSAFALLSSNNGSALTALNASQLTSGSVNDARLSANVALLNGTGPQTFTGSNSFTGLKLTSNLTLNYDVASQFLVTDANKGVSNAVIGSGLLWDGHTLSTNGGAGGGGGSGTVTSAAFTMDGVLYQASVTGSPITTTGTFAPSLLNQAVGTIFGNGTGSTAAPAFTTNGTYIANSLSAQALTSVGTTTTKYLAMPGSAPTAATLTNLMGFGSTITLSNSASDSRGTLVIHTTASPSLPGGVPQKIGSVTFNATKPAADNIVFINLYSQDTSGSGNNRTYVAANWTTTGFDVWIASTSAPAANYTQTLTYVCIQ